jgi:hypothetical protein
MFYYQNGLEFEVTTNYDVVRMCISRLIYQIEQFFFSRLRKNKFLFFYSWTDILAPGILKSFEQNTNIQNREKRQVKKSKKRHINELERDKSERKREADNARH